MAIVAKDVVQALRGSMGARGANALGSFITATATNVSGLAAQVANVKVDIPIPLGSITLEDGTALTKQATTAIGYAQIGNKELVIMFPASAATRILAFTVPMPADLDEGHKVTVKVLASKAANTDTITLDCEGFFCAAGDLANADSYAGAAVPVVAAGTLLSFDLTSAILAAPCSLSVILITAGTCTTDAVYIHGVWVEYTRLVTLT